MCVKENPANIMNCLSSLLLLVALFGTGMKSVSGLPTLFEYYTANGIESGLVPTADGFLLNGKPYRLISGAIHYFRVHPSYWRDRLRKLRAAGVTAVETYVPWNLHEYRKDVFDFGTGTSDMSPFLDLVTYIQIAQEEDLFVIFRPGPFICSEWDFGGLPSWLLRDYTMHVRTMYSGYIERADIFFDQLIPLVTNLQFSRGGPVIAIQIENEYGAFGYDDQPRDTKYLQHLMEKMISYGITEMFFTSDSPLGTLDWGAVPGALQTANFQSNAAGELGKLQELQPNMPLMVTEYWTGWFDHWTENHHTLPMADFNRTLREIFAFSSSVNFYMFHGGTNFGFMNGANALGYSPYYLPDITSYDYDAQLSEAGDYTVKYEATADLIKAALAVETLLPPRPSESIKTAYPSAPITTYLTFNDLINQVPSNLKVNSPTVIPMEELPIHNSSGQSFGFVIYRKSVTLQPNSQLLIRGHIRDMAQIMVNGARQTPPVMSSADLDNFGSWLNRDSRFTFSFGGIQNNAVMDIIVENMGRVNFGKPHNFIQKKGLWEGPVLLDGSVLSDWQIIPLEFLGDWVRNLQNWKPLSGTITGPVAVQATFNIDTPTDTFLDMSAWGKGVVFINGFNLGRYWSTVGPQKTLYLPGPLLKAGENKIVIYEQYTTAAEITFVDKPNLGPVKKSGMDVY